MLLFMSNIEEHIIIIVMERNHNPKLVRTKLRYKGNRDKPFPFLPFLQCVCVCICLLFNKIGGRGMGIDNEVVCNLSNLVSDKHSDV